MAKIGGDEAARSLLAGALTAVGAPASGVRLKGAFNFSLWGTFTGTVLLERSFDDGATWLPLTALGSSFDFSAPCTEVFEEAEAAVLYRPRCTAFASGTINYRLSQ